MVAQVSPQIVPHDPPHKSYEIILLSPLIYRWNKNFRGCILSWMKPAWVQLWSLETWVQGFHISQYLDNLLNMFPSFIRDIQVEDSLHNVFLCENQHQCRRLEAGIEAVHWVSDSINQLIFHPYFVAGSVIWGETCNLYRLLKIESNTVMAKVYLNLAIYIF